MKKEVFFLLYIIQIIQTQFIYMIQKHLNKRQRKKNPFIYNSVLDSQVEFEPNTSSLEIPKLKKEYSVIKFPRLKNYNLTKKKNNSSIDKNYMGTIGKEVFPVKNLKNEIIQISINPKNSKGLEESDIGNVNKPKSFDIDCTKLRYPTNKKDIFYKKNLNNKKNLNTLFTKKIEKRKEILSKIYKQCFQNFEFEDTFENYERFLKENSKGDLVNADLLRIFSYIDNSSFSITDLKDILLYAPRNSTIYLDTKTEKNKENLETKISDKYKENIIPEKYNEKNDSKVDKKFFEGKKNHRDYTYKELNMIMDKLERSRYSGVMKRILGDLDKLG